MMTANKTDKPKRSAGINCDAEKRSSLMKRKSCSILSQKRKKKRDLPSLRKAPQAPKRFRSSYICFFTAKQSEIKRKLGDVATIAEVSRRSAQMWKTLSPEDRRFWDNVAAKDKQRYLAEKASYIGPWQIPNKRAKKDPSAPKRPMSAFLHFSRGRRSHILEKHPELKNTEVSKILGDLWRKSTEEERRPYVENEKIEREKYKAAMSKWKENSEKRQKEESEQLHHRYHQHPSEKQYYQPSSYHHQQGHNQSRNEYSQDSNHENNVEMTMEQCFQPPFTTSAAPRHAENEIEPSFDCFNQNNGDAINDEPVTLDQSGVSHDYLISQYPQPSPQQKVYTHFPYFGDHGYHFDEEENTQSFLPLIDSRME